MQPGALLVPLEPQASLTRLGAHTDSPNGVCDSLVQEQVFIQEIPEVQVVEQIREVPVLLIQELILVVAIAKIPG